MDKMIAQHISITSLINFLSNPIPRLIIKHNDTQHSPNSLPPFAMSAMNCKKKTLRSRNKCHGSILKAKKNNKKESC